MAVSYHTVLPSILLNIHSMYLTVTHFDALLINIREITPKKNKLVPCLPMNLID